MEASSVRLLIFLNSPLNKIQYIKVVIEPIEDDDDMDLKEEEKEQA
jgi:hypothetical protein